MSILIGKDTRLLIQGITGRDGSFHTKLMNDYSGRVVAGVTPGKEGQKVHGIPVFGTVENAIKEMEANTSVVFVPGKKAGLAIEEAVVAGIKTIVIITEGVPVHDMMPVLEKAEDYDCNIIGPNTPGILVPDVISAGIIPTVIAKNGSIGLVSRSGTLTYQITSDISKSGLGISTALGIGGDQVVGTSLAKVVELFESDDDTEAIVIVGEIGGLEEQYVSKMVKQKKIIKPVISYIAGVNAPPEKRMGHAGAIISARGMSAEEKIKSLKSAGIKVASLPWEVPSLIKECI